MPNPEERIPLERAAFRALTFSLMNGTSDRVIVTEELLHLELLSPVNPAIYKSKREGNKKDPALFKHLKIPTETKREIVYNYSPTCPAKQYLISMHIKTARTPRDRCCTGSDLGFPD